MKEKFKKVLVSILVVAMMLPIGTMIGSTEEEATTDTSSNSSSESSSKKDDDGLPKKISDEQAIKSCKQIAKDGKLELWFDEENERVCLVDKSTSDTAYWWSTPINVLADDTVLDKSARNPYMKDTQRQQINSNIFITYGDKNKKVLDSIYSGVQSRARTACETTSTEIENGIKMDFAFTVGGFNVPVEYKLEDGTLKVSCDTSKITEATANDDKGKVLTKLALTPSFGAAAGTDENGKKVEGYMIVPDGSGAVIQYNNGKSNYSTIYQQDVYGRDYTTVPLTAPRTTEQAYMPVLASVQGNHGLVAVATQGDANVTVNARVNGQANQTYNQCWFDFTLRGTDDFYLSGEAEPLTVFEKEDIKAGTIEVTYYPLSNEESINYADCAKVYRDYLINEKNLKAKTENKESSLYIDFYGGVIMQKSILGIPFDLQTSATTFQEAQEILEKLKDRSISDIVVNYNDWTSKSIDKKISTELEPASKLGGEDDFNDLKSYAEANGIELFPSLNNVEMLSSTWGYWTFSDTAVRVSNAYSRQSRYSPAFSGTYSEAPALLTPTVYSKVFEEIEESMKDTDTKYIGYGEYASKLVSDYSLSDYSNRQKTQQTLIEGYKTAKDNGKTIIADAANSFLLPYVDRVTNIPVTSSKFNLVDYDIPFYQMVMHGYVPYSSTSINKSSDSEETFLLSLAFGSDVHFDLIATQDSQFADTDYGSLYYAYYEGWMDSIVEEAKIAKEVFKDVKTKVITNYEYDESTKTSKTTYGSEDGSGDEIVIEVCISKNTVKVNGQLIDVSKAVSIKEGGSEE